MGSKETIKPVLKDGVRGTDVVSSGGAKTKREGGEGIGGGP